MRPYYFLTSYSVDAALLTVMIVGIIVLFIATVAAICFFLKKNQDFVVVKKWHDDLEKKYAEIENKHTKIKTKYSDLEKKYSTTLNKYNTVMLLYFSQKNKTENGVLYEMEKSLKEDYERFKTNQDFFVD